jgi:hypothetical protein
LKLRAAQPHVVIPADREKGIKVLTSQIELTKDSILFPSRNKSTSDGSIFDPGAFDKLNFAEFEITFYARPPGGKIAAMTFLKELVTYRVAARHYFPTDNKGPEANGQHDLYLLLEYSAGTPVVSQIIFADATIINNKIGRAPTLPDLKNAIIGIAPALNEQARLKDAPHFSIDAFGFAFGFAFTSRIELGRQLPSAANAYTVNLGEKYYEWTVNQ